MALSNILQKNSYSIIENVSYSKHKKEFSCILSVFSDFKKYSKLTELYFHVNGRIVVEEVDQVDIVELPSDFEAGKTYIVSKTPDVSLQEYAGKTIVWKNEFFTDQNGEVKKFFHISFSDNNIVWVKSRSCYCKVVESFPTVDYVSSREFDKFFNAQVVTDIGLIAASYNYVKSKPLAVGAVDC